MLAFLTAIHVMICIGLIIVVLLQTGRGAGMASVFGGGGEGSLIGGKGFGSVLAKATTVLAIAFLMTSIILTISPRGRGKSSVIRSRPAAEVPTEEAPPAESPAIPEEGP